MCSLLFLLPLVYSRPSSWEINLNSTATLFGDMVMTPRQLARYANPGGESVRHVYRKETSVNRWTNNIVPYSLSDQYTPDQVVVLKKSLQALQQHSCFRFVERTTERDYLFIVPLDGCYSYVGKIGGRQLMSLAVDCLADFIIWHEVMHAIGFEHEHQRPDRDQWIRVEYTNVQPGQMQNFEKIRPLEVDYPDRYDYKSIMHYDGLAFGRVEAGRRLATMVPVRQGVVLEDNMKLSSTDIAKLNRLGRCEANKRPAGGCKDDPTANCARLAAQCSVGGYQQIMNSMCPETCGTCGRSAQRDVCSDLDPRCTTYAANGFCENNAYGDLARFRCRKTCGHC